MYDMTDDQKILTMLMEINVHIDGSIESLSKLKDRPFDELTREEWALLVEKIPTIIGLIEFVKVGFAYAPVVEGDKDQLDINMRELFTKTMLPVVTPVLDSFDEEEL